MRLNPLVLAIDDDEFFRHTISAVLPTLGMKAKVMAVVEDLYHELTLTEPDLILVDLEMGDVNGLEVIEEIRAKGHLCPIVVVSGNDDFGLITHALEIGASDYILKPFDKSLLAAKLSQFMNTQEITDQEKLLSPIDARRSKAEITFEITLTAIDELGVTLSSCHLLPKSSVIRLRGEFWDSLGSASEGQLVSVTQTTLDSDTGLYEVYAEFEGVDVEFLQAVRKWIHGQKKTISA